MESGLNIPYVVFNCVELILCAAAWHSLQISELVKLPLQSEAYCMLSSTWYHMTASRFMWVGPSGFYYVRYTVQPGVILKSAHDVGALVS